MTEERVDPAGILRLGMARGIADFVLGEAVHRLQVALPRLDLRLRADWNVGLCQQLAEGGCRARAPAGILAAACLADRTFHRLPTDRDRSGKGVNRAFGTQSGSSISAHAL
jgi:hypothetical protein